jgi:GNAT superfamily N-acetyltransferase
VIRPATEDDLGELLAMVRELAEFESLSDQCICTEEDLRRVLFAPGAIVNDTVAVADDGSVVGHALWFRTFSTFMGKSGIWLEDLYVRPAHRRRSAMRVPA